MRTDKKREPVFLRPLLVLIASVQVVLGVGTALFPGPFFETMGFESPPPDNQYLLGMLASRFLVLGFVFFRVARNPLEHRLLVQIMFWIQILDLLAGISYTLRGFVSPGVSAFPMFNAGLFALLLYLWLPRPSSKVEDKVA